MLTNGTALATHKTMTTTKTTTVTITATTTTATSMMQDRLMITIRAAAADDINDHKSRR
jgi:hypothetical protein